MTSLILPLFPAEPDLPPAPASGSKRSTGNTAGVAAKGDYSRRHIYIPVGHRPNEGHHCATGRRPVTTLRHSPSPGTHFETLRCRDLDGITTHRHRGGPPKRFRDFPPGPRLAIQVAHGGGTSQGSVAAGHQRDRREGAERQTAGDAGCVTGSSDRSSGFYARCGPSI
jgi:hypothetical protein